MKPKPQLIVTVDVLHQKVLNFTYNGKKYRVEGECLRCGVCCKDRCHWLDYEPNGLAKCLLHGRSKPWDCFLFPATRDPSNPLPEKCGYKIVEVK